MSAPRRVLVVDDHPVVRRGVRNLLEATDRYTVVGEAGTADSFEIEALGSFTRVKEKK